jgi:uncharacterized protein YdiU (UPF0061 family)
MPYRPDVRVTELGDTFYDRVGAETFPKLELRFRNQRAAAEVGLETLTDAAWIDAFGRFQPLPENLETPLALRYHGHQFGTYNPQLGDGRGFLFAQLRDSSGRLLDLGTKGTGRTPWSRGGDGKLTLQGAMREVLAAEMLEALFVPTSRALSVVETGESPFRHDEEAPIRGAVLVRLSHSHVRFGTFQRLAHLRDVASSEKLVAYVIEHLYPELSGARDPVFSLFDEVVTRVAKVTASYMVAGFVHGVLNSDNMNVTGESFDYGPWRFSKTYDPSFTAAYFDQSGYYAYGRQGEAALRNLGYLADALAPLGLSVDRATLGREHEARFQRALREGIVRRLGLVSIDPATDTRLAKATFDLLAARVEGPNANDGPIQVGFAQLFHDWFGGTGAETRALARPHAKVYTSDVGLAFRKALSAYPGRAAPSAFDADAPCDLPIEEVRALWSAIAHRDDFTPFLEKVEAIRRYGAALRA